MSLNTEQKDSLRELLTRTRDKELDCDEFLELLAPFVEKKVKDPRLLALFEHHLGICPECAEELEILKKALGLD